MFNSALPRIPLTNEQELLNQANALLSSHDFNPDSLQGLISQSEDTDTKTAFYYEYIRHKHQHFINKLNHQSLQSTNSRFPKRFIVIPAMLHEKYPALGGDGMLFADVARNFGHEVEILKTNGGQCRQDVISILSDLIQHCKGRKICLVGLSRGTSDIFSYLHIHGHTHIDMIINIAGIIKGTPLSSYMLATKWRRFKYRLIAKCCNVDFRAVGELACENTLFLHTQHLANAIPMINFVGVPLKSHIQTHLLNRYLALAKKGPNDGMIMLEPYLTFPGYTYPIWGGDHFFRLPGYSRLLYQLFNLLEENPFA